jgi:hypothetical protein
MYILPGVAALRKKRQTPAGRNCAESYFFLHRSADLCQKKWIFLKKIVFYPELLLTESLLCGTLYRMQVKNSIFTKYFLH